MKQGILLALLFLICAGHSFARSDFFSINQIRVLDEPGPQGQGVYVEKKFVPCVQVEISTPQPIYTSKLLIKAYFFDADGKILSALAEPSDARRDGNSRDEYGASVILPGKDYVFFKVPTAFDKRKGTIVIVFGDSMEVAVKSLPAEGWEALPFTEKKMALAPPPKIERIPAVDPVIEHVVRTNNPTQPKITLFLRMPENGPPKGVLALSMLANSTETIHRALQKPLSQSNSTMLRYAGQNQLAVVCWGARRLWRADASYDELDRETNRELDRAFDDVANAWERGVNDLGRLYGIPTSNFLLAGTCASAQWAHRLALRKPQYFLAIYIHIPSSFDQPTPEGAKPLWLLTTGELDGGYSRSIRWYGDCVKAGYPMVYKAVKDLGHAGSPIADSLAIEFFNYAMGLRAEREKTAGADLRDGVRIPWPEGFRNPSSFGDLLNQEMMPSKDVGLIPTALRVALPNQAIANAWNR